MKEHFLMNQKYVKITPLLLASLQLSATTLAKNVTSVTFRLEMDLTSAEQLTFLDFCLTITETAVIPYVLCLGHVD